MALYAISDLHLALSGDKPMDIFGDNWYRHDEKIKNNWINIISEKDTVLIAGDISWSMHMEEGIKDLEWIHSLPGTKIFIKGNHDYFWTSITKLNELYEDMNFIQNNFYTYRDYAICGTRGWNNPKSENFTEHDEKIYRRELIRLRLSLETAVKNGFNKIIVMVHFPPFSEKEEENDMTNLLEEYPVEKVIYGHLHGSSLQRIKDKINKNNLEYIITSCDYINFTPIKILE
ncbi:Ser/Thr protein phosphatase family protein [Clostridium pasteurianum DSM 525 = ATCC 6013]|uniref:Metallophosphoesterase n=1 Tax=Clostridium pasteurianum DSM 525 = ATCC 6013 TaxID=1262449 RepID=A0A0H3J0L2_CLOPA|nr:metallophosphoesterase [Clostridium pasteurianum]AJA47381.1 Ser/Thr protein phosphatase family protein [Clostridium pasteurianum DSM 525 = ATCC 6013]AJA51369.1 Ser/Thr protein phosphatase family protein [Clostridium pasteurianum DSM 525 = ATCC 6013]AOZ74711.1 serine/threonine protein phosphatase [Clostridium pasteurianum DSM 525 = ATCC 6013]AOZ78507.1 serine/threonine protein phosphatase [Clostridium pasteurianum]ELP58717.1 metallophosphoesterase [Clostridium pasteurianum DSM 525 = ATCC 601